MASEDNKDPGVVDGAANTYVGVGSGAAGRGEAAVDPTDISITAKKAGMLMQKSALANSATLVERETLKIVIEENHRRFTGCLMLPVTLLFFVFYAGAATMHEDITMTHLMESPVRNTLTAEEGGLPGIVSVDDVWTFLNDVYVPTFWSEESATGETLYDVAWADEALMKKNNQAIPKNRRGRFYMYNNFIGAAEFSQQRSKAKLCEDAEASHMMCYDQAVKSTETFGRPWADMPKKPGLFPNTSRTAFDYYLSGNNPIIKCPDEGFKVFPGNGVCPGTGSLVRGGQSGGGRRLEGEEHALARRLDDEPDPGNTLRDEQVKTMPTISLEKSDMFKFYMYQGQPQSRAKERLAYLKDRGYIDHQTTSVTVKTLYINSELDIPRVDEVGIFFYVSRGGGVYVKLRMEAIFLKTFSRGMTYFWDFLFFVMLLASTIWISVELCMSCKRRQVWNHFTWVNIITWITCLMGWFNAAGLYFLSGYRVKTKEALENYWIENTGDHASALQDSATNFVYFASWYRVFVADAHIIFMLRCFIALQWQPRLAVVTNTLMETSVDLFHFLIVFVPTFISFAIAGNVMFGRRVSQFSTIEGAICVCFKISMESEFDWAAYSEEDFLTAMTWVWLYVLLVVLLMLNMVLAIIMDVYSVIRLQAGNSETVVGNICYLCRRAYMYKKWVKDAVLLERVSNMPRTVAQDEVLKAIPELTEYQLSRLMNGCFAKVMAVMRMGVHESYTAQMTAATKIGLDGISSDIAGLKEKGWMGRGIEAGTLTERMLAQDILQSAAVQNHWMSLMQAQIDNLRKKTSGKLTNVNLLVTFFSAAGLPMTTDVYAMCFISGKKDNAIKTRTKDATNQPNWEEELCLEGYDGSKSLGLQFNVFEEGSSAPMVAAKLAKEQFFPDGFDGDLPFPGGVLHVKVEITSPDTETTV